MLTHITNVGSGANPTYHWVKAGFTWTRSSLSQSSYRDRQPCSLMLTPTGHLESNYLKLHVLGLWEEAGEPGGNPEHANSTQKDRVGSVPGSDRPPPLPGMRSSTFSALPGVSHWLSASTAAEERRDTGVRERAGRIASERIHL